MPKYTSSYKLFLVQSLWYVHTGRKLLVRHLDSQVPPFIERLHSSLPPLPFLSIDLSEGSIGFTVRASFWLALARVFHLTLSCIEKVKTAPLDWPAMRSFVLLQAKSRPAFIDGRLRGHATGAHTRAPCSSTWMLQRGAR
jgi:hypothetical protein